jgi:glycosyltransferase involved in cell wall biosynthesis
VPPGTALSSASTEGLPFSGATSDVGVANGSLDPGDMTAAEARATSRRVLLMSPLPDVDPFCGDVVYSQALLENPPDGWHYVPYTEALRSGELVEHGRRAAVDGASSLGSRSRALVTVAREHAINALRDHNLLFREPFRFMEIRGKFDLVHCHTYSARWTGRPTPVLVSNAIPLRALYADARGWSPPRVAVADRADRILARALGVEHVEYGLGRAARVMAFTQTLADWYRDVGVPTARIGVVPCFPPGMDQVGKRRPVPGRIGFVGGDFEAKGGDLVRAAMADVRLRRPEAHLAVAGGGSPSGRAEQETASTTYVGYLSRSELLSKFLPACDVFAYPSRFDGLPLTLLEAMGTGLPCVVSDYFALPEVVGNGGRAVPVNSRDALASALLELLEPSVSALVGERALARYRATYSAAAVRPRLGENYEIATRTSGRLDGASPLRAAHRQP